MASVSLRRYGQIADVLVKYGSGDFNSELYPGFINTKKAVLGGITFGQLMSTKTEPFTAR